MTAKSDRAIKVTLAETSKAQFSGRRLKTEVQVTGKGATPFIIPRKVSIDCTHLSPTNRCNLCVFAESRTGILDVTAGSRNILAILGKADSTVSKALKRWAGVCDDCRLRIVKTQNIEEIRVSPNVSSFIPHTEYVTRECFFIGHSLMPNRPYELTCYVYPSPIDQRAVLVAETATPLRDQLEEFDFEACKERLEIFRGKPSTIFKTVYADFEANVHRIVGRYNLQVAFDLCFHSVLNFTFRDVTLRKGWVEGFILGDSGQGKTEMSLCLLNHYNLGDRVQGEGSSTAGLIGGLERMGDRWILTWGRIVQMDRRLLIIDEFSGISDDNISRMSDIRSTGVAEITKIRTERASARTRLIMMSNTRDGLPLGSYNTGAEAMCTVFSHAEDIRRLEFAICVASGEVTVEQLNAPLVVTDHIFTSEACRDLILWAWSRKPEQVIFTPEAEQQILDNAEDLSDKYSATIPLVEPADMRLKLARLAVSCACRCFSSDSKGNVIVLPEHVFFVTGFLQACYDNPTMAYDVYSDRVSKETTFAPTEFDRAVKEFQNLPQCEHAAQILRSVGNPFRSYELSEQLNIDNEDVREIIYFLSRHHMIRILPVGYRKLPKLNLFLRHIDTIFKRS